MVIEPFMPVSTARGHDRILLNIRAGDQQGIVQSVMAICADQDSEPQGNRRVVHHQRNAPKPTKVWQTNDLIYLQSKGVFDLPSPEVCDALVQKYFEHVHPLLPVINAGHFLSQYARNRATAMNLLLLWSVLLAAANVRPQVSLLAPLRN
jgi:hypothetical protein